MSRQDSIVQLAGVAVVIAAAVGVHRAGFDAATNASNNTSLEDQTAQIQEFSGLLIETFPLLALALAAIFVVSTVR